MLATFSAVCKLKEKTAASTKGNIIIIHSLLNTQNKLNFHSMFEVTDLINKVGDKRWLVIKTRRSVVKLPRRRCLHRNATLLPSLRDVQKSLNHGTVPRFHYTVILKGKWMKNVLSNCISCFCSWRSGKTGRQQPIDASVPVSFAHGCIKEQLVLNACVVIIFPSFLFPFLQHLQHFSLHFIAVSL